ncbi:carcinoembryonic antigen-related cell adhesion molecule 1-like [Pelobates cultripes]|uniref:Carcinoembryonic antigen-related cell adhesion molecule 1-like n=1 Tax=Pelobates cultripes TaxID=61616 RepID=A0AAD1T786_PELCU|nr:carcinoembryonic antigen-related cell adhesion molecule 1-like [Pelobates cultripes]
MQPISALSIQVIPQYPAVGQSVTLSVTGINGNLLQFSWYKGPNRNFYNLILSYIPSVNPPQINGNQYFSRASRLPNVSLLISDLVITDQGIYTVSAQTDKGPQQESVTLTVYIPVTKPVVRAISSLEYDMVTLTCRTENAENIVWGRRNDRLPSDITLSNDNRTLTFSSIKQSHSGDYYCEAENVISKTISDIYTVTEKCRNVAIEISTTAAGIISGSACGIVFIISATFLLYKRYVNPVRKNNQGRYRKDPLVLYDNIPHDGKGLQFKCQDTYGELKG